MNYKLINQRIRDRLDQLGESSFDVSIAIGKNRNFLNDLMSGKKKSFSADMLPDLARALRCDANYLLGMSDEPSREDNTATIPVAGSIEPGVWRKADRDPSVGKRVPMRPDPRFPAEDQQLWLVRSDTLDSIDLSDGGAVLTVRMRNLREWFNLLVDDDLVVAEREREGDVLRTVLRARRDAAGVMLTPEGGDLEPMIWKGTDPNEAQIRLVGVVIQVVKFRG